MNTPPFVGSALVTGAASGIGQAVVELLVEHGVPVVGLDLNAAALEELGDRLGGGFTGVAGSVTDDVDVRRAVDVAHAQGGGLGALFNVAGGLRTGTVDQLSEDDWDFTVDLVLKGVFLGTRAASAAMIAGGRGGAIVNISSLNAHVPLYGGSAYAAGKAGVEMFGKNAALELGRHGIRVNTILPGLVNTPMAGFIISNPGIMSEFNANAVLKRPADPRELAAPAVFLASTDASYITGTSLVVDGGYEIGGYPDLSKY
ncbi:SDR family NAD(P)-dependent oxidoreductase [Galactobacter valiniphilus]|uniref:SDR family NAD(P)-dependent oxidoreductase n=1 Tax=Galactobacter valiniphilus TaxID=2676122 RepID=UPI003735533B